MRALWWIPSVLILGLLGAGALSGFTRLLAPERAFAIFAAGLAVAAVTLPLLAGAAALASSAGKTWRRQALAAAAVPLGTVLLILLPSLARVSPPIHDITTDPADSLQLPQAVAELPNGVASEIPREEVLALQHEHYPELGGLETPQPPERVFPAVLALAEAMPGWEVRFQDAAAGSLHATVTSRLFGFVDDVVIRVQPAAAGSRVDLRSRSRFGQSDLGSNAARIERYLGQLRARLGS